MIADILSYLKISDPLISPARIEKLHRNWEEREWQASGHLEEILQFEEARLDVPYANTMFGSYRTYHEEIKSRLRELRGKTILFIDGISETKGGRITTGYSMFSHLFELTNKILERQKKIYDKYKNNFPYPREMFKDFYIVSIAPVLFVSHTIIDNNRIPWLIHPFQDTIDAVNDHMDIIVGRLSIWGKLKKKYVNPNQAYFSIDDLKEFSEIKQAFFRRSLFIPSEAKKIFARKVAYLYKKAAEEIGQELNYDSALEQANDEIDLYCKLCRRVLAEEYKPIFSELGLEQDNYIWFYGNRNSFVTKMFEEDKEIRVVSNELLPPYRLTSREKYVIRHIDIARGQGYRSIQETSLNIIETLLETYLLDREDYKDYNPQTRLEI